MADLLGGDEGLSVSQGQVDEDPAAEFLAREQTELAALDDDDFVGGNSGEVPPADGAFDPLGQQDQGGDSLLDDFSGPPADTEPTASDEADFFSPEPQLDSGGYDLTEDTGPTDSNDFFGDEPQETYGYEQDDDEPQQNGYSAIGMVDRERQEPEKLKEWRAEQVEVLAKKDAEEEEKITEWEAAAKQELQDWFKHQNEQVDKTKVSNREAESEFVKDRDESIPGQDWERIARLCEFNPKNSKNTKDVSRMRSILLQLKQTPLVR